MDNSSESPSLKAVPPLKLSTDDITQTSEDPSDDTRDLSEIGDEDEVGSSRSIIRRSRLSLDDHRDRYTSEIGNDSGLFPIKDDDLFIEIAEKPHYCDVTGVDQDIKDEISLDPQLKATFRVFRGTWKVIRRKYQNYEMVTTKDDLSQYWTKVELPPSISPAIPAGLLAESRPRGSSASGEYPHLSVSSSYDPDHLSTGSGSANNTPLGASPLLLVGSNTSPQGSPVVPSSLPDGESTDSNDTGHSSRREERPTHDITDLYRIQIKEPLRSIFRLVDPYFVWDGGAERRICHRRQVAPFMQERKTRFLVAVHTLKFELKFEPFFGNIALYDIKRGQKISENFFFHLTTGSSADILNPNFEKLLISSPNPKAVFSVTEPHDGIFAVIWIEKVLQHKLSDIIKYYQQPNKANVASMKSKLKEACANLSWVHQPFIWSAIPLFKVDMNGKANLDEGIQTFRELVNINGDGKNKFDVIEAIRTAVEFSTSKSSKFTLNNKNNTIIPGECMIEIIPASINNMEMFNFEEELLGIKQLRQQLPGVPPSPMTSKSTIDFFNPDEEAQRIKALSNSLNPDQLNDFLFEEKVFKTFHSVSEFPVTIPRSPYVSYINTMYIYPESVNFGNVSIKSGNPRNICVKVLFRQDDKVDDDFEGMMRFHSKFVHPKFRKRERYSLSSVTYHEKYPQFFDEMQVDLPVPFDRKHHLLFVFYHISVKADKKGGNADSDHTPGIADLGDAPATVVGYSFLRLLGGQKFGDEELGTQKDILPDETHSLYVFKKLVPGYLESGTESVMEALDKRKLLFKVRTKMRSTVYPQDPAVNTFFKECSPLLRSIGSSRKKHNRFLDSALESATKSMYGLRSANFQVLLPHLPVLMNMLIDIMVRVPDLMTEATSGLVSSSMMVPGTSSDASSTGGGSVGAAAASVSFESPNSNNAPSYLHTAQPSNLSLDLTSVSSSHSDDHSNTHHFSMAVSGLALTPPVPRSPDPRILPTPRGRRSNQNAGSDQSTMSINGPTITFTSTKTQSSLSNYSSGGAGKGATRKTAKGLQRIQQIAFLTFINLLKGSAGVPGSDSSRRNTLLSSYVQYIFDNPFTNKPVYATLAQMWLELLTAGNEIDLTGPPPTDAQQASVAAQVPVPAVAKKFGTIRGRTRTTATKTNEVSSAISGKETIQFAWLFFDIIVKSITLYTRDTAPSASTLGDTGGWSAEDVEGDSEFLDLLKELLNRLMSFLMDDSALPAVLLMNSNANTPTLTASVSTPQISTLQVNPPPANIHTSLSADVVMASNIPAPPPLPAPIPAPPPLPGTKGAAGSSSNALTASQMRELNSQMALFVRDLFGILNRAFVIDLINIYVHNMDAKTTDFALELKLDFVEIISEWDGFVQMNNPLPYPFLREVAHIRTSVNALARILGDIVLQGCQSMSDKFRQRSANLMRNHITKLDFDSRFQDPEHRSAIAAMYLPFVLSVADYPESVENLKEQDLRNVMFCIVYILRNLDPESIRVFWANLDLHSMESMMHLFEQIVQVVFNCLPVDPIRKSIQLNILEIFRHFLKTSCERLLALHVQRKNRRSTGSVGSEPDTDSDDDVDILAHVTRVLTSMMQKLAGTDKDILFGYFFPELLKPFLEDYASAFANTADKDYKWRGLLGALMELSEFPSRSMTKPIVRECLAQMISAKIPQDAAQLSQQQALRARAMSIGQVPDGDDNIVFDPNDPKFIKLCTLEKLVERLTFQSEIDPRFRETFFLSYRSFTTPLELLELLKARFETSKDSRVTLRVTNAFKHWIEKHFYDFDDRLIVQLTRFTDEVLSTSSVRNSAKQVKKFLEKSLLQQSSASTIVFTDPPQPPQLPKNFDQQLRQCNHNFSTIAFNLVDWPTVEIARQLTLIEYNIFKRIQPRECFGQGWQKSNKEQLAPNMVTMARRFNHVSRWVSSEIMRESDLRRRRALMIRFIEMAECFRALNNFNGIYEIIGGLTNAAVFRMQQTWEGITPRHREIFDAFSVLMSHTNSYQNIRKELSNCSPPCIPYIGVFQTDLVFLEDGNPDFVNGLINFTKRHKMAAVIMEIQTYQHAPYNIKEVPYLKEVLSERILMDLWDDDRLYARSLELEPRRG